MAEGGVVRQLNTMEMPDVPYNAGRESYISVNGAGNLPEVGRTFRIMARVRGCELALTRR